MEAILGVNDSKALKNYSVIFEKLLRLRQGKRRRFEEDVPMSRSTSYRSLNQIIACCSGLLLTQERRDLAIKIWDDMRNSKEGKKLSAEEGLALLEKLKGAFSEALPECGICLTEMEESDGTVLAQCGHVFCKLCIQQVLAKSNRRCPYCRASFVEGDIVDMIQAKKASCEQASEENPAGDLKFGIPPKTQALLQAIEEMHVDEKGGKFISLYFGKPIQDSRRLLVILYVS